MKDKLLGKITILLLLLLALTGCSVTGVSFESPTPSATDSTAGWPESRLMLVNQQESDYREALLYLLSAKEEAELLYGKGVWDLVLDEKGTSYGSIRKQQILEEFIRLKIIVSHAAELNVKTYEEENSDIAEYTEEFIKNVGKEKLLAYNISESMVKTLYLNNTLATKIYEAVTLSVDTNVSDAEARQGSFEYIFKSKYKTGESGIKVPLDETALQTLREKMQSLRTTGLTKSNFLSYAQLNTEAKEASIIVGAGSLSGQLEQIVLALSDGEFSPVIEDEDGFYIFKCIHAFDEEATMLRKEEILSKRQKEMFEKTFALWQEQAVVVVDEKKWESINP